MVFSFLEISGLHFSFFPPVNPVLRLPPQQAGSGLLGDLPVLEIVKGSGEWKAWDSSSTQSQKKPGSECGAAKREQG